MRVVVDAHMLGTQESGNETYVTNLLGALDAIEGVHVAAAVTSRSQLPSQLHCIETVVMSASADWLRLTTGLGPACRRWGADLLHVTYTGPLRAPCPVVTSVHDVSFKRFPSFFSPRDRLLFGTLVPVTLRGAAAVITLSEHARQEIEHFFPALHGRVRAIPLAASSLFSPMDRDAARHTLPASYPALDGCVLAVGNLQPRKNLASLVRAFARVRATHSDARLVIAGRASWRSSQVLDEVQRRGLQDCVHFAGHVSIEVLLALYSVASVFVYPSLYEGFGLPILEAMACGTPVIASNTSSMPEVAGDAALLVDPLDEEQIASAICRVIECPDLAQSMSQKGLAQAGRFSWKQTAEQTVEVYRQVLASQKARERRKT